MQQMQDELSAAGQDVAFVAINSTGDEIHQSKLVAQCSFPLFQDVAEVGAWQRHGGGKDDIYVYLADGTLSAYLPFSGPLSTSLATPEGYQNLLDAIAAAGQ